MKWTALTLVFLSAAAIAASVHLGKFQDGLRTSYSYAVRLVPVILLAVLIMGYMEVLLPKGWVEAWLTDASGWRGLGVAWLAGMLTPGGSLIGMPVAAGLLTAGASPAVVVTYLTSLATLNLMRLPMEVGFCGARLTVLRFVACLVLPFLAGGVARLVAPLWMGKP